MRGLHIGPDPDTTDGGRPRVVAALILAALVALPAMAGDRPCRVGPYLGIADGPDSVDPLGRCLGGAAEIPLLDVTPPAAPLSSRMTVKVPLAPMAPERGCTADETAECVAQCHGRQGRMLSTCDVHTDPHTGLLTLFCGCSVNWKNILMVSLAGEGDETDL